MAEWIFIWLRSKSQCNELSSQVGSDKATKAKELVSLPGWNYRNKHSQNPDKVIYQGDRSNELPRSWFSWERCVMPCKAVRINKETVFCKCPSPGWAGEEKDDALTTTRGNFWEAKGPQSPENTHRDNQSRGGWRATWGKDPGTDTCQFPRQRQQREAGTGGVPASEGS